MCLPSGPCTAQAEGLGFQFPVRAIGLHFSAETKSLYISLLVHKNISYVLSLGPHCTYFRMRKLKPQVAKASTVASVMRDK